MRKAMNENPVVQVVLLGVLGIVVAFLFMTRVMSKDEGATEPAASATDPAAAVAPATSVTPSTSVPATPSVSTDPVPVQPVADTGFVAGPGLPGGVVDAYETGDAVVLLVTKHKGIEDRKLRAEVGKLRSRGDATIFMTSARNVARYSRIAEGVDLQRVPALVVLKPKSVSSGPLPEASISYGFRGPESVAQALRDALYKGKQLPYHPG